MTPSYVERVLREFQALRDPAGDPALEAVKAAVFLEDVFGITLEETEIDPELLGTEVGMRAVLRRRWSPG
jgi:hypothetical protein